MDEIGDVLFRLRAGPVVADDGKANGARRGSDAVFQRFKQ